MNRNLARAYFSGVTIDQEEDKDSEESVENKAEDLEEESEPYIAFTQLVTAMGMSPRNTKWVVDGVMIDTGSNVVSSIGLPLFPAAKVSNMRKWKPVFGENPNRITGISSGTEALGMLEYCSHLGGRE